MENSATRLTTFDQNNETLMYKQLLATTIIELLSNSYIQARWPDPDKRSKQMDKPPVTCSEMQNNFKNSMHTNRYRCIPSQSSLSLFFSTRCTFLFSRVHTGRVNGFQISNISDRRQSRPAGVRCTRMVSLLACCRKSRYRL